MRTRERERDLSTHFTPTLAVRASFLFFPLESPQLCSPLLAWCSQPLSLWSFSFFLTAFKESGMRSPLIETPLCSFSWHLKWDDAGTRARAIFLRAHEARKSFSCSLEQVAAQRRECEKELSAKKRASEGWIRLINLFPLWIGADCRWRRRKKGDILSLTLSPTPCPLARARNYDGRGGGGMETIIRKKYYAVSERLFTIWVL